MINEILNGEGHHDHETLYNFISLNLINNKMRATIVRNDTRRMEINEAIAFQECALVKLRLLMDGMRINSIY